MELNQIVCIVSRQGLKDLPNDCVTINICSPPMPTYVQVMKGRGAKVWISTDCEVEETNAISEVCHIDG